MINTAIPLSNEEIIRDRLGSIITSELANQVTLIDEAGLNTGIYENANLNATVWLERNVDFDNSEMPAINVRLMGSQEIHHNSRSSEDTITFFIDFYNSDVQTPQNSGDYRSKVILMRIVNIVKAIIRNPSNYRLQFDYLILGNITVKQVLVSDDFNQDATFNVFARMIVEIRATEKAITQQPRELEASLTGVTIAETENGFKYELQF